LIFYILLEVHNEIKEETLPGMLNCWPKDFNIITLKNQAVKDYQW